MAVFNEKQKLRYPRLMGRRHIQDERGIEDGMI
jgi:hypothetical protein